MDAIAPQSLPVMKQPTALDPAPRPSRFASGMAFTIELVLSVMLVFALLLALASL